ncbi:MULTISPECIES: DHA2 family efflux MFS transporter permease subunit [unclassified Nocardia]|uniref:DHA2 family efflux MFS transporter permease subunit n=1 Tax=unclassified Nocardia TaxID=2637762 RepID=UPI001CE46BE7|nr:MULTISPECIES: DHA2 family efflux MFS transporter permease subunit [unclassified Nocardia]
MTISNLSEDASERPGLTPRARRAVVVVLIGAILAFLDATVVNVALKSLSGTLGSSLDAIQWVVTVYLLAQAAVLPVTGWAVRRIGAKRLYLVSLLVFVIASIACGLSGGVGELIAARVFQGIGGGVMVPAGQMILVTAAGPRGLARVMAAVGIPMVLTPVVGPTIGGLLLENVGWQWIFLINVPLGVIGLLLALRLLPADERAESAGPLDVFGLALASLGMACLTYALAEAGSLGISAPRVLITAAVGIVALAAFVLRSLRVAHPVLDVRLYRDALFSSASVATFIFGAATFGAMVLLPLYFQLVRHQDAAHTGMMLAPQGIGAAVAMAVSSRVFDRIGSRICVLGSVIGIVATLPFMLITADMPYWVLAAAMVVRGAGIGLAVMPAMTVALGTLRPEKISDATPQLNIMQRLGGSIGTAVFVIILDKSLRDNGIQPADQAAAFGATFAWVLAAAVLATLPTIVMAVLERRAKRADSGATLAGVVAPD